MVTASSHDQRLSRGRSRFVLVHLAFLMLFTIGMHWSLFYKGRILAEEGTFFMAKAYSELQLHRPFASLLYNGHLDLLPWLAGHLAAYFPSHAQIIFPWIALIPYLVLTIYGATFYYGVYAQSRERQGSRCRLLLNSEVLASLVSALLVTGGVTIFNDPEPFMSTTNSQWIIGSIALLRVLQISASWLKEAGPTSRMHKSAIFAADFLIPLCSFPALFLYFTAIGIGMATGLITAGAPISWIRHVARKAPGLLCGSLLQILLTLIHSDASTSGRVFKPLVAVAGWLAQGVIAPFAPGPLLIRMLGNIHSSIVMEDFRQLSLAYIAPAMIVATVGWAMLLILARITASPAISNQHHLASPVILIITTGLITSAIFAFLSLGNKASLFAVNATGRYFFIHRSGLFFAITYMLMNASRSSVEASRVMRTIAFTFVIILIVVAGASVFSYGKKAFCLDPEMVSVISSSQVQDLQSGRIHEIHLAICPRDRTLKLERGMKTP